MQTLLTIVAVAYICFLVQIIVHCNVHNSLFGGSKTWNQRVGTVLCQSQCQSFLGYKLIHFMHHRYTNTERDPHHVDRPLIPYIFTHYSRLNLQFGLAALLAEIKWGFITAGVVIAGLWLGGYGALGVKWALLYWLVPVGIAHLLVAHFNYWGHVNLGNGRRRDTRSGYTGIWWIINKLTLNFYMHAEHHLRSKEAIPTADPDRSYAYPMAGIE